MTYKSFPFDGKKDLSQEVTEQISQAVKKADGKVLVHCSSGNRAAAWLASYLYKHNEKTANQSLETAKAFGLTKEPMEEKVKDYLRQSMQIEVPEYRQETGRKAGVDDY